MNTKIEFQSWDIYINGTKIRKVYSKRKAIELAQNKCGQLFETRVAEVIDALTGEVVFKLNL